MRLGFPMVLLSLVASLSCKRPDPGTEQGSLQHGGVKRTYLYRVPDSAPAPGGRMLLIALHGRHGDGTGMEQLTGFSTLADERGFVVVYPDGVDRSWADGRGTTPADEAGLDDVGFVGALIDEFIANQGVDPARVFVAGMSNGSMMTHRLGCTIGDRLAGLGAVSGTMPEAVSKSCALTKPLPVVMIHGTADPFIPYSGGDTEGDGGRVLSAADSLDFWADRTGCSTATTEANLPDVADDGLTARQATRAGCGGDHQMVLVTIDGGGHAWPGKERSGSMETVLGPVSRDVDGAVLLVDFFQRRAP